MLRESLSEQRSEPRSPFSGVLQAGDKSPERDVKDDGERSSSYNVTVMTAPERGILEVLQICAASSRILEPKPCFELMSKLVPFIDYDRSSSLTHISLPSV